MEAASYLNLQVEQPSKTKNIPTSIQVTGCIYHICIYIYLTGHQLILSTQSVTSTHVLRTPCETSEVGPWSHRFQPRNKTGEGSEIPKGQATGLDVKKPGK